MQKVIAYAAPALHVRKKKMLISIEKGKGKKKASCNNLFGSNWQPAKKNSIIERNDTGVVWTQTHRNKHGNTHRTDQCHATAENVSTETVMLRKRKQTSRSASYDAKKLPKSVENKHSCRLKLNDSTQWVKTDLALASMFNKVLNSQTLMFQDSKQANWAGNDITRMFLCFSESKVLFRNLIFVARC